MTAERGPRLAAAGLALLVPSLVMWLAAFLQFAGVPFAADAFQRLGRRLPELVLAGLLFFLLPAVAVAMGVASIRVRHDPTVLARVVVALGLSLLVVSLAALLRVS